MTTAHIPYQVMALPVGTNDQHKPHKTKGGASFWFLQKAYFGLRFGITFIRTQSTHGECFLRALGAFTVKQPRLTTPVEPRRVTLSGPKDHQLWYL